MRLATLRLAQAIVPAVANSHGGWIPLSALLPSYGPRVVDFLEVIGRDTARLSDQIETWTGAVIAEPFTLLPPVPRPPSFRDFYAFEQHVKTARARRGLEVPPAWYELPVFYFSNPNALIGDHAEVHAPDGCLELDYELELGIVIGRAGRDIAIDDAWNHVAGLTILNDFSARDLQRKEVTVGLGPAKAKDFATAVGPWLVTLDEFAGHIKGDTLSLGMRARVNGRELSRGNVNALFHSIPRLIAHASRDADLIPGDLIGTGTVGTGCILELGAENTGGWLQPGDLVELEIERLGVLHNHVVPRPSSR
jgi:2-keto-4-pentenoate hydratase/2-oxohepta-3-ene-1,7-dioic acid hydratase in catechol pathway